MTLGYGNYGMFLIMGKAGFISSTVGMAWNRGGRVLRWGPCHKVPFSRILYWGPLFSETPVWRV